MNSQAQNLIYQSVLAQLYGRIDYERNAQIPDGMRGWKLERMRAFLDYLENPERKLTVVHVAGTKGKGSTASMIGSILTQAGFTTGVYTSPHFEHLEERIAVNGACCSEADIVRLFETVWPAVERTDREAKKFGWPGGATFFEITTAMAMVHFVQMRTELSVLEVGLGGRLDSTNVCHPIVSVVTSISFDHTKQLGNTLELIAREKAGIIKPAIPVVSGVTQPGPRAVIEEIACAQNAPLWLLGRDFTFELDQPISQDGGSEHSHGAHLRHSRMTYREGACKIEDLTVGLIGAHQVANASLAVASVRRLEANGLTIPESAIRAGLASVRCPARIEVICECPHVILDVAHNVAATEALVESLTTRFQQQNRVLLFAASRDKDAGKMLEILVPHFSKIILTRFVNNPRAYDPERLAEMARMAIHRNPPTGKSSEVLMRQDPLEAWLAARQFTGADDLLCVTGSFFLVAEIQPLVRAYPIQKREPDDGTSTITV